MAKVQRIEERKREKEKMGGGGLEGSKRLELCHARLQCRGRNLKSDNSLFETLERSKGARPW